jgi:hypothetical protein
VKVDTSVRRWQVTFDTALDALDGNARYLLRARIKDRDRQVEEFTSRPFQQGDLTNGRLMITELWRPEKLWDTHTPQNQYDLSLSLLDAGGAILDTALPVRFGFREFWIDGRDFYLNGTRLYLSAIPLDNGQLGPTSACYDGARATLQRFKSFGINFVYTHNYGCEPGAHISFEEVLRAADDEGMLVSFSQPHFGHYDWAAPDADQTNGYARHAEFYVRVAQNHPSVVCYSTSHNSTGYGEDMNPDMIDGIQNPRDAGALRNAGRALRAEAIIRGFDSSRKPCLGQPGLDALDQLLCELGPHPGDVRLVRALGHGRREAGLHLRVQRAVPVGLGDVPRLVQGEARVRQRRRAVGVLRRRMERPVPRRPGLSYPRGGESEPALGSGAVPQGPRLAKVRLPLQPQHAGVRRALPRGGEVSPRKLPCLPRVGRVGDLALGIRSLLEASGV